MVIDITVLAVLLISALISFIRGFIRETLTILGVVGGLAAAYFGGPVLSPVIKGWLGVVEGEKPDMLFGILPYPILADLLSYGLIFVVVIVVLSFTSHFLAESVRAVGLGAVDRTLGVMFGLARGLLLVAVLYLPFHLSVDAETKERWFKDSRTHAWMEILAKELASYLPDSTVKQIEDTTRQAREETTDEDDVTDTMDKIEFLKETINPQEPAPAGEEAAPGYSDEFRDRMDQMFEQETRPAEENAQE